MATKERPAKKAIAPKRKTDYRPLIIALALLAHVLAYTSGWQWALGMGVIDLLLLYFWLWPKIKDRLPKRED